MPKPSMAATRGLVLTLLAASTAVARPGDMVSQSECSRSTEIRLSVCINVDRQGPTYDVYRGGQRVIERGRLGLVLDGFGNQPATRISNVRRSSVDQSWEQPWGEQRVVRDRHLELKVTLSGEDAAHTEPYDLTVRVFDDGIGFRYEYNQVAADRDVAITDELTEFRLVKDFDAWWYPARNTERDE